MQTLRVAQPINLSETHNMIVSTLKNDVTLEEGGKIITKPWYHRTERVEECIIALIQSYVIAMEA